GLVSRAGLRLARSGWQPSCRGRRHLIPLTSPRRKPERRVFRSPFGWQDMLARLRRACPRRFPWRRPGRERGRRRGTGAEAVAGRSEAGVLARVVRVSIPDAAFGLIRATCRSPGKRSAPGFPSPFGWEDMLARPARMSSNAASRGNGRGAGRGAEGRDERRGGGRGKRGARRGGGGSSVQRGWG